MKFHCLQHVAFEGPGAVGDWVKARGLPPISVTCYFANDSTPKPADFDLLLVLGGPMGVYDEDQYPWLLQEQELIAEAIHAGKHVLGICLGAQLIAGALGARVYPGKQKE